MTEIYRQGDVLIRRIDSIPLGVKMIPKDAAKKAVVLAYGEVTGHHHMFDPSAKVTLFTFEGAMADTLAAAGSTKLRPGAAVPRLSETSSPFAKRYLKVSEDEALLKHDEHTHIPIPYGDYEVVIQREFSPEAIRQVHD
jgi:hypothetical protein